jgi:hypothetical protein
MYMIIERGLTVNTGDVLAEILGMREDLFFGWFELYCDGRLYLHYVNSLMPGQGNTSRLIDHWLYMGFDVHVVRPGDIMKHILEKRGFLITYQEIIGYHDTSEVMYRKSVK